MAESRDEKATRLIREGRVDAVTVVGDEQWAVLVEGDTDTYLVERTPEGRFCECYFGAERLGGCSHFKAGASAVAGQLFDMEGVAS